MKLWIIALSMLVASTATAAALKWSDRHKVEVAKNAIDMANALAAGTPQAINCRINLASSPGARQQVRPEVVLQSGQQAFTNLLAAMTTKLNNDKTTAEAYLASVGVTND